MIFDRLPPIWIGSVKVSILPDKALSSLSSEMMWKLLTLCTAACVTVAASRSLNLIAAIAGENPLSSYYTALPYFDASLQIAAKIYPKVFQNVTKTVFYQPGSGGLCDDADAEMPDVIGRIYDIIDHSDGFPIIFATGCTFGMICIADLAREINVPFLSQTSDPAISNRQRCPTTLSFSSRGLSGHAPAIRAFLLQHKWTTVSLICDTMSKGLIWGFLASQCRLLTAALASGFQLYKENYDSSKVPVDLEALLQRTRSQSRVNIIFTGTAELRKIMAHASRLNMTNGEFVFLYILPPRGPGFLPIIMDDGLGNETDAIYDAYKSLITVNFPVPHFAELSNFIQLTERIAKSMYGKVFDFNDKNNEILTAVPEMVLTIGQVLSGAKTPLDNMTTRQFLDGFIGREFLNQDFLPVYLGANGIRIVDSVFNKLNSTSGTFCPAWKYNAAVRNLTKLSSLADQWKGSKEPPLNEPLCGFRNNRCDGYGSQTVLAGAIVASLGVVVITAVVLCMRHLSATDQSCLRDLEPTLFKLDSCNSATDVLSAVYNEERVLAHELASECVGNVTSSGQMPRLLKQLCTMRHTNIGQFYGIVKQPVPCGCYETACTAYAVWMHGRGTLREIFESQVITVDGAMKLNFIFDVLTGLHFIHINTLLKIHGSLSTSTVILDSRLTAKICDVGSIAMKYAIKRLGSTGLTTTADIASLGVVFHEILGHGVSSQDTVQAGSTKSGSETFKSTLLDIVQLCQSTDPDTRPTTKAIWARLRPFREERTLVEIMLNRLEEHARNLEIVVSERTADLIAERANVDKLLSAVIPPSLITQLRRKESVLPETFASATIYFSSMVGFDDLCISRQPDEVRTYLNELYRYMDNQIAGFNVYKVETINDSYMVASGLPVRNGDQHVDEIASMALHVAKGCSVHSLTHFLPIRIGMHTGPVVAGVVGVRMPRYCLFGDTINTASRMESHGEASKIHVSPDTAQLLTHRQDIRLHSRGQIVVKGKGVIETFWLSED